MKDIPALSFDGLSLIALPSFCVFSIPEDVPGGFSLSSASNLAKSASRRRMCLSTCIEIVTLMFLGTNILTNKYERYYGPGRRPLAYLFSICLR